jgi:hypothetical protein
MSVAAPRFHEQPLDAAPPGGYRRATLREGSRQAGQTVAIYNDNLAGRKENVGREGFYDEAQVFTVKAGSTFTLRAKNVPDASKLNLTFEVLNTCIAPREHLQVTLTVSVPN